MRGNRGFLLLEVIVSMVILTSGLLFVMKTYSASNQAMKRSADLFKFGLLLEEAMFGFEEKGEVQEGSWEQELGENKDFVLKANAVPLEFLGLNALTLGIFRRTRPEQKCSLYMYLDRPKNITMKPAL